MRAIALHNTAPCHSHSNHHIFTEFRNRSGWRAPKQRSPSSLACEAYLSKETGERASWAGDSSRESTGIVISTCQGYAAAILTHPYTHHRPQHLDSGPQNLACLASCNTSTASTANLDVVHNRHHCCRRLVAMRLADVQRAVSRVKRAV